MGESTPRQQPSDDQETEETLEEANAGPGEDAQAEPDPSPASDPVKKQGPQSKFHG